MIFSLKSVAWLNEERSRTYKHKHKRDDDDDDAMTQIFVTKIPTRSFSSRLKKMQTWLTLNLRRLFELKFNDRTARKPFSYIR